MFLETISIVIKQLDSDIICTFHPHYEGLLFENDVNLKRFQLGDVHKVIKSEFASRFGLSTMIFLGEIAKRLHKKLPYYKAIEKNKGKIWPKSLNPPISMW